MFWVLHKLVGVDYQRGWEEGSGPKPPSTNNSNCVLCMGAAQHLKCDGLIVPDWLQQSILLCHMLGHLRVQQTVRRWVRMHWLLPSWSKLSLYESVSSKNSDCVNSEWHQWIVRFPKKVSLTRSFVAVVGCKMHL